VAYKGCQPLVGCFLSIIEGLLLAEVLGGAAFGWRGDYGAGEGVLDEVSFDDLPSCV